ncbi:hypothetical protein PFDG_05293, partial [Plasmodium falciparum Dd2]
IDKKLEDMINDMESKNIHLFIEKNQNNKKNIPMTNEQLILEIQYINEMNNDTKTINKNEYIITMNKDQNKNISYDNNTTKRMGELYKNYLKFLCDQDL